MMLLSMLPFLILLLVLLSVVLASVLALRAQRNWATITMVTSSSLFCLILLFSIISFYMAINAMSGSFSDSSLTNDEALYKLLGTLMLILPITFVAGLIGFMQSSKSAYLDKENLELENALLKRKLDISQINQANS